MPTQLQAHRSKYQDPSDQRHLWHGPRMEFEKHLSLNIRIYDTATWTFQALAGGLRRFVVSPNGRILASTSILNPTPQLWNLETGQLIGAPLHHEQDVSAVTFSADEKFLVTSSCSDSHIYTWDVSAVVKEAGLPSDIVRIHRYTSFWKTLTMHPG
jgi:WD40 repeat protein